ncbi:MAG: hypothetical protein KC438_01830 [Thermomicrobiales bacterium]|nr:hypothetical protein [Thermomicrobiales bacterium]MCO5221933.1 hypothetical protein [Thermomicrobiales bacterium]
MAQSNENTTVNTTTDASPGDVAARLTMIEQRIAHPLTEEGRTLVTDRIVRSIALGAALHAYPLANADEPEIDFDPLRGRRR